VELDVLADRKLPAREQKMRNVEEDLYFVLDERGHSVHLTEKGVETMSPQDPNLFVVRTSRTPCTRSSVTRASHPRRRSSVVAR